MKTRPSACVECRNLIGGYVLDALEHNERDTVRRHLAACPDCAAEHARLADLPRLLALVDSDESVVEPPPATLEDAVLDRFAREHRRPPRGRRGIATGAAALLRRPLAAAAAGALATGAVAAVLIALIGGQGTPAVQAGHVYRAHLSGSPAAPRAHAWAKLETSPAGTSVRLRVSGLPGNPDDLYELWCVRDDGTKISAGTFRVDARGQADVDLTTAAVPGEYTRMSVERKRHEDTTQQGQRVLAGTIEYGSS